MKEYPRFVKKDSLPFDPLKLAEMTEKIVCKNSKRKYTDFYCTGVYGGISTGYLVGCCLRCIFCWVDLSREFPESYGKFYSPEEVCEKLLTNASKCGVKKVRVSGGEPTLCREHLLKLIELIENEGFFFILETNGILLGDDPSYIKSLKKFKNIYLRISLKAASVEGFQRRTGAIGKFYLLPFQAIKYALSEKLFFRVAVMSDPLLMDPEERQQMLKLLKEIGYNDYLEEERCDPYSTTILRLKYAVK